MESKLILSLARSFFAVIAIIAIGVCFKEQSSSASTSSQTIQNTKDSDGGGFYQTIDTTNNNPDASLLTFGILGGASMLALGLTFVGKRD